MSTPALSAVTLELIKQKLCPHGFLTEGLEGALAFLGSSLGAPGGRGVTSLRPMSVACLVESISGSGSTVSKWRGAIGAGWPEEVAWKLGKAKGLELSRKETAKEGAGIGVETP